MRNYKVTIIIQAKDLDDANELMTDWLEGEALLVNIESLTQTAADWQSYLATERLHNDN